MRNPFRQAGLRLQFEACVKAYDSFHRDLRPAADRRCRGNSLATQFWRGFDNVATGLRAPNWDRASKDSYGYAAYVAGQAVARREKEAA